MDFTGLKGKTALVTGAARRIGRAIVVQLAAQGVNIIIHYNNSGQEVLGLLDELKSGSIRAFAVQADLAEEAEVSALWEQAVRQAGFVDILINNASIFHESTLLDFSPESLERNIRINSLSGLLLARKVYAQARPASIINLLDTRIADCDRKHIAYHLSKRMLYDLTRIMALEFAPRVRVNAIAPGAILPPAGTDTDRTYYEEMLMTNPLGTHGDAEEIADAVLFLLCSRFITGQVLFIDGGRHLLGAAYG